MLFWILQRKTEADPGGADKQKPTRGRDGQYFKYMYFKYVFEIQNTILYLNTFEKNQMYFVFKYI